MLQGEKRMVDWRAGVFVPRSGYGARAREQIVKRVAALRAEIEALKAAVAAKPAPERRV